MAGFLSIVLHAHLPFVRQPRHARFLEESWFYEALAECYLPLIRVFEGWEKGGVGGTLTLTLSPTLCAMLSDPLLMQRFKLRLQGLIQLAEKEMARHLWQPEFRQVAQMYHERFRTLYETGEHWQWQLLSAFKHFHHKELIEIVTCSATHAVLPLLAHQPGAIRAQIQVARAQHRHCFGMDSRGIWLPECAYVPAIEPDLKEAGIEWFLVEAHGLLNARPRPRLGLFAPIITPRGLAVFGRDIESAQQVWSRQGGYPGDFRYRDFYRDIGFEADFDYIEPYLPCPVARGFTGFKYHAITGLNGDKKVYDRAAALAAVREHAAHFLQSRRQHLERLSAVMGTTAIVVAPYDAELFGHWWFEGPEFIDQVFRLAAQDGGLALVSPSQYLDDRVGRSAPGVRRQHTRPTACQLAEPSPSSWGEAGYWHVWLNAHNEWIYKHLIQAQALMVKLAADFPSPNTLQARALRLAGNELLQAQASDWPFIMRTGSCADYARERITTHLSRLRELDAALRADRLDPATLTDWEGTDLAFPHLDLSHFHVEHGKNDKVGGGKDPMPVPRAGSDKQA